MTRGSPEGSLTRCNESYVGIVLKGKKTYILLLFSDRKCNPTLAIPICKHGQEQNFLRADRRNRAAFLFPRLLPNSPTLPRRHVMLSFLAEKKAKLIVVGAGKWGLNHVSTAYQLQALVAVVDPHPNALDQARERLSPDTEVEYFGALSAAMHAHPEASIVVATPPATHYSIAKQAIHASRHVLVEKPLCVNVQHAAELIRLASYKKVTLMVDHLLQYSLQHRRLLQLVRTGFVGEVTRVRMSRMNFGTVRTEENVLWSFAPHDVSILLSICGDQEPATVQCVGQKVVTCGIDDYIDMSLRFADGVQAQIEASWLHPLKERRLIVYGSKGALILNEAMPDDRAPKIQGFKWSAKRKADGSGVVIEKQEEDLISSLTKSNESRDRIGELVDKPPLALAVEHFLECQSSDKPSQTDGKEGMRVLKVLSAAADSLSRDGARVDLSTGTQCPQVFVHSTAVVDSGAIIGPGTKIWHFSHIMPGAKLGPSCNIGQNVYIGGKASLGRNVKVQNNVSLYDAVTIADDVFLGPSCVLTNVKNPRSHVSRKDDYLPTAIGKGATIGANATIVCGVRIGSYSFIGAGAVVTKDIPAHALVYGNPATIHGWVSTTGTKLIQVADLGEGSKILQCTESKEVYCLHEKGRDGSGKPCLVMNKSTT